MIRDHRWNCLKQTHAMVRGAFLQNVVFGGLCFVIFQKHGPIKRYHGHLGASFWDNFNGGPRFFTTASVCW